MDVREAGDQRRAKARLELGELGAVKQPRKNRAHGHRLPWVGREQTADLRRVERGRPRRGAREVALARIGQRAHELARDAQRMRLIIGEVVGDARRGAVQVSAAELLGGHHLARRRLYQRRSTEKDRAVAAHDDRLISHRGDVRATGGARAEDDGELRDPGRRHARLVVEDPPEAARARTHR